MINGKNVYTLVELQAEAAKDGFYLEFDFRPTTDISGEGASNTFAARFVPMGYKEEPSRADRHVCGLMGFNPTLNTCQRCETMLDTEVSSVEDIEAFMLELSDADKTVLEEIIKDIEATAMFDDSMKDIL